MKDFDYINKFENKTILNSIFSTREEELYSKISKAIKGNRNANRKITYEMLSKKLEDIFQEHKEFKEYIEKYMEQENLISADENELFYKYGFSEGAKLIIEISHPTIDIMKKI